MSEKYKNDMPYVKNGRHIIRNDIIFIASLLLIVSVIGACIFFIRDRGDSVKVTVDGKIYGTYSLSQDTRIEIYTGKDETHLNVLVIKDGMAYVERATCPDGICSSHRAISRNGESIVCLPHKVVITVISGNDAPDVIV